MMTAAALSPGVFPMDVAAARGCFPGTRDRAFLDAACVSLMPQQAADALTRLSQDLVACPARDASSHHIALDRTALGARRQVARLINCRPEDIALVESTTHGLEVVAASVPLAEGDKVLVGATEFLGVAVPWIGRQRLRRFAIEVVPARDGRLLAEDFAARTDGRTRLILLSSVQWSNGFRSDLAAFGELARRRGVTLVVDAIQQLGAIALDVGRTPVDFLVCGGHKWLNAPAGRGFLYVHPRQVERLRPPHAGYLNVVEPPEGWAEYFATPTTPAVRDYDFTRAARGFEVGGTANYPGNVVLGAAVGLINDIGIAAVEGHVLGLAARLRVALRRAGATVVSPEGPGETSGIITFTLGHGPARDREVLHRLWDCGVVVSQRYTAGVGGLRASVHFYNNDDDVGRLAEVVAAEIRGDSSRRALPPAAGG
jgi:selenocysteine lyase/cysteine desulfurase